MSCLGYHFCGPTALQSPTPQDTIDNLRLRRKALVLQAAGTKSHEEEERMKARARAAKRDRAGARAALVTANSLQAQYELELQRVENVRQILVQIEEAARNVDYARGAQDAHHVLDKLLKQIPQNLEAIVDNLKEDAHLIRETSDTLAEPLITSNEDVDDELDELMDSARNIELPEVPSNEKGQSITYTPRERIAH